MHTPSLEEFELEDLSSYDEMSDEQLAEHAMNESNTGEELAAEKEALFEGFDEDSDYPPEEEFELEEAHRAAPVQQDKELLTSLQQLVSILEHNQSKQETVQESPAKLFAKAVHYVKSDKNHYLGAKWFRKAAMLGHAKAQLYLGLMFLKGEGLPKSFFHAYAWLSLAACQEQNEAKEAMIKLEPHLTAKETKAALKHAANLMEAILD